MTSRFLSSFRLDVTTLGPVHIGTGNDMDPTNYVLDQESAALFEFSPDTLFEILDERDRTKLLDLVSERISDHTIPKVQEFIQNQQGALIADAERAVCACKGVVALYKKRIGNIAQRESGAVNRLEIEKTFADSVTGAPVLPGSSLKGAIRTALLNAELNSVSVKGPPVRSEKSSEIQKRLFKYNGFETDPLRLIHVADTVWEQKKENHGLAAETKIMFAVNRKKKPLTKNGREIPSRAQQKGLYQLLETIPPFQQRAFRSQLMLHRPDMEHNKLPAKQFRWSVEKIAKACNDFYLRDFKQEAEALQERGFLDQAWSETMQGLLGGELRERINSNRAFLLRVGRHSGAESVTLDGVRKIKIMKGNRSPDFLEQSTTWWLASDEMDSTTNLLPFGWVLVELADGERPPERVRELTELMTHPDASLRIWRDKARRLQGEWRAKVDQQANVKRQQEAAEQRKRAEQDRQQREEEQRQQALREALSKLPEDAAWAEERRQSGDWSDTNRFLTDLEEFVSGKQKLSNEAYKLLASEVSARWGGILENPDAVRGKQKKPKYRPRPRELAKKLAALKPEGEQNS